MAEMRKIVVTGFGPFGPHTINASWQAVEELSKTYSEDLKSRYNVKLIVEQVPVVYNHVNERIPTLWHEYDPLFVIHVGVSSNAEGLVIEGVAHSSGYCRLDVDQNCPTESNRRSCQLTTEIDVEKLCQNINNSKICSASVSNNAGRYLCEYIYYQSLQIEPKKTIFVHVPVTEVCPTSLTAQGLHFIISHLLDESYCK